MSTQEREWSLAGLALSCLLAVFSLCLEPGNPLLRMYDLAGVSEFFIYSFLAGVVALCAVVLVSSHDEEKRLWSIGVGLAAGAAGTLFSLLFQLLPAAASAVGSGFFLGFGVTCLLRQWGRYYRLFTFRGALLSTMLSFLLASCLWFAVMHAGTPFLFGLGLLALVFCGGLPLLARQIVQADEARMGVRDKVAVRSLVTMRQVVSQGWAAVIGLALNFFIAGLLFWPGEKGLALEGLAPRPVVYAVLALVVWWTVSRARQGAGGSVEAFYRVSLPLAACVSLACLLVDPLGRLSASPVLSAASYVGVAVCNVLGLAVLFWTAKSSEVGFSKVFAAFCASGALSAGAGMVAFHVLGQNAQEVALALLTTYLAAMVLFEARAAYRSLC